MLKSLGIVFLFGFISAIIILLTAYINHRDEF